MPGLPEIEVLRRDLDTEFSGQEVQEAEIRPGSGAMKVVRRHGRRREFQELLQGARVSGVERVGNALVLDLDNDHGLVFRLGPSARLLKRAPSERLLPGTHIVVSFAAGAQLRLVDPKKSSEAFVAPREAQNLSAGAASAFDPFAGSLAWTDFWGLVRSRPTTLKGLLLDDRFVAGLGDVYSDEVLFASGMRYDRPTRSVSSSDVRRLYRGLMEVLQDAVKARGFTLGEHDFRDLYGRPGGYQNERKVFEREGGRCIRCKHAVAKTGLAGGDLGVRVTYFCPQCQT